MSMLFKPMQLGKVEISNRFVHSATCENMASEQGEATDALVKRYRTLAQGQIGLIIPGNLYVHPLGRAYRYQTGIHHDDMIPGLKRVTDAVHDEGGKIVFQLTHAGRQTTRAVIGQTPMGPSGRGRDPSYLVKPDKMTEEQIQQVIRAFGQAAARAMEAGADGVQVHAAHGYLVSQFLSPFFNDRDDAWGGTDENRFRFLKEVIAEIQEALPEGTPLLVKLNANDYAPKEGMTPALAARYGAWLAELGINGLEISCGTIFYSVWNMARGDVPVDEISQAFPTWQRPMVKLALRQAMGKYDLEEGYNVEAARVIRPAAGPVPLFVVGGLRHATHMEAILEQGVADCISMSRPFIREPHLVRWIQEGRSEAATCTSCNRCLAAVANDIPVRCYVDGFPR
jgi:2,4-dienoyl-CoA reductase-like NADH-dependent reductase (Old Yellow Enzyme family)